MTDDRIEKIRAEVERLKESRCESPIVICDILLFFIDSLQEEPIGKVWHESNKEPEDKSSCLIHYIVGSKVSYTDVFSVLYNKGTREFISEPYPHPTGYKVEQKSLEGGVVSEVYKNMRDRFPLEDISKWAYLKDILDKKEEPVRRTKAEVDAAMQDVEEKSKAFTEAHKGESAEEILAQMKGEEPILEVLAKYLDHVSREEAMKTKGAIDRWFGEYYPEPVSEELEEAAKRYAIESYPDEPSIGQFGTGDYEPYVDMSGQRECAVEDFKAGAKWQKQRDEDEIRMIRELLDNFDKTCDEYHDAGFKHGQEALMKDAVECDITGHCEGWLYFGPVPECDFDFKNGDKVKLIIIKED